MFKINPHREKNIVVQTVCGISKQTLSQIIHHRSGHVSITQLKRISRKVLVEGLSVNLPLGFEGVIHNIDREGTVMVETVD